MKDNNKIEELLKEINDDLEGVQVLLLGVLFLLFLILLSTCS